MERIAIVPGSFDPITLGHESLIRRALPLFDKIIIAIGINSTKQGMFSIEDRMEMISKVFEKDPSVFVETYTGLTIELAKKHNAQYLLRGLRNTLDFEFEKNIAQTNNDLCKDIETVLLFTSPSYSTINSTIIREIIRNGGDVSKFVSATVLNYINS